MYVFNATVEYILSLVSRKIYSDSIRLSVLNLNRINDATSELKYCRNALPSLKRN